MDTASIESPPSIFLGTRAQSRDFVPFLRWLIVMCLTALGVGVLWKLGLIRLMFATDRTRPEFPNTPYAAKCGRCAHCSARNAQFRGCPETMRVKPIFTLPGQCSGQSVVWSRVADSVA